MDRITKQILKDLKDYGWNNTSFTKQRVTIESTADLSHQSIAIDATGIHLHKCSHLTLEELDLIYRLKNKWIDSK